MIKISHRGNLIGPNPERENSPHYIFEALAEGFEVEIDVWINNGMVQLGHDRPTYTVNKNMLKMNGLWCHAKNIEALAYMTDNDINCFWHQGDDVTLTNHGYIWTHSDYNEYGSTSVVCHMGKASSEELKTYKDCYGICSDYIGVIEWQT
jgi:hypothetical protein